MDYAAQEPFGGYHDERRHGEMMAFHHNANRDREKRPEPFRAIDFMNVPRPPERKLTPEELELQYKAIFGA